VLVDRGFETGDLGTHPIVLAHRIGSAANGPAWPLEEFLEKWQRRLLLLRTRASTSQRTSIAELDAWIRATRKLAAGVDFDDHIGLAMREAADSVDIVLKRPAQFFARPPRDARRLSELYFSADLWAVDRLRTALKKVPGLLFSKEKFFTALLGETANDQQAALEQRVWRLHEKIRPGQADPLMAAILNGVSKTV